MGKIGISHLQVSEKKCSSHYSITEFYWDLSLHVLLQTCHKGEKIANIPDSAPLFSFETDSGYAILTKDIFQRRVNAILSAAGLGCIHGHGFRIGGTTHLLLSSADPWMVMRLGRWTSKAFLRYWRKVSEILPLFIGNVLDTPVSVDSLRAAISHVEAGL